MSVTAERTRFDPAPLEREVVLEPRWLGEALSRGAGRPVNIQAVELLEAIGWNCITLRVKVAYAGGDSAGLPEQMCIKGLFGEKRPEYIENGALSNETNFYRHIAPEIGITTPECYYAGLDEQGRVGVVLIEDLVPRGARFLNGLYAFSQEEVRDTLDQLARLHAWSWEVSPDFHPWVRQRLGDFIAGGRLRPDLVTDALHGSRGKDLPEDLRNGQRLFAAIARLHERSGTISANFIHGDCHPGNMYKVGDRMGLLDWQIVQRNNWALDIAYHLGSVLDIDDRRRYEKDLLRYYLDRLGAHGATPPAFEQAWQLYRESVPYGFFLWAVTMRVDQPIIDACVSRLGTSVADHQSYALLGV